MPPNGPVILVSNHAAFLDGPFVFAMAPRPVNFLVKQEAFTGVFGALITGVGQIPIDRAIMGTRADGADVDAWPPLRSRLDVVFGSPFELSVPAGVPGRERLRLATEQLRDTLASHVRLARVENGPSADFH